MKEEIKQHDYFTIYDIEDIIADIILDWKLNKLLFFKLCIAALPLLQCVNKYINVLPF